MAEDLEIPENVRSEAADWVERLTSVEPSKADVQDLRSWLAEDPRHRRAYEQARAVWTELDRVEVQRRRVAPALAWGGAIAASIAALVWLSMPSHDLVTPVGGTHAVRLADGTRLWVDSDSAVDVAMTSSSRLVTLARGRVAVDVARDARPFTIKVGDARITDIGTAFSVDRSHGLDVRVLRGIVDVAEGGEHHRLEGGQALAKSGVAISLGTASEDDFAWRARRMRLDNVPFSEEIVRLNRYYPSRIVLGSGVDHEASVSGTLFLDDPEKALAVLMRPQGLIATHYPWVTVLSSKK